ncbi:MAG: YbgC/FadM family acyl-CoA thioesterase [Sulfuricurvum sp.]|uniref:YbgC/FadM family acyl-CoA thioesterase n=1 Tax=Sulfuricurvum sp. TaxID=2025608 RepID=UPI002628EA80|nr:YbgC/FadM family acyl-CoA thioesterase [Sulfuricurvum sp.]MDD2370069.1 YbgC/FadM family acyl-CoA thioesterase [Sulfuricurvum sp.]MDD2951236.1 YbgC/FadM family acyl-CoA thioesterase [Sulfuricurvum sp.]MDD5118086.1 YbgC/FadM family acyl-CoA thioesterase [Sulfuricurvum sp.]
MKIRVYYEDTDVGGVVYHSNYINFCERARSQLFFDAGRSPILEGGHFVAKHIEADYIKSAKFADILDVKTTLVEMKHASFTLLQQVFRNEEKIFEMTINLVHLNFEGKMTKIPSSEKIFLTTLK